MAMAPWTWTPAGGMTGLDVVPGIAVRPHADAATWASVVERFGAGAPAGLGLLGVPERTAAITDDPTHRPDRLARRRRGRGPLAGGPRRVRPS